MVKRLAWTALCVALFTIAYFLLTYQGFKKRASLTDTAVKIEVGDGHGSGVFIEGGIITAAHVVNGADEVDVVTRGGSRFKAEVLWVNKKYDVALLTFSAIPLADDDSPAMARLYCAEPAIGQTVQTVGNPGPLEFIHSWGRVGSSVTDNRQWRRVFISSLPIAPGSSGGPVFDHLGRMVGIAVGISLLHIGPFPAPAPYAYIVPSSAICTLLARNNG